MKRIGLFGGTFDPIHTGHIKIAGIAKERAALDSIIFIPSGDPPHKISKNVSGKLDRLRMTQLATEEFKDFSVSDYEIKLNEKSYSVNMVKHFNKLFPDAELYFIIGADSLYDMPTWWHYRELLSLCVFIVISRPGIKKEDLLDRFSGDEKPFRALFIDDVSIDISSTSIRNKLKCGNNAGNFLPPSVYEYIKSNGLYI